MKEKFIYHIITREDWQAAQQQGVYKPASLESEGFIHCSTQEQVADTANRFFKEDENLVLLQIACEKLTCEVRYENLEGGIEQFPHLYGSLDLETVAQVLSFNPGQEGLFRFPVYQE